MKRLFIFLGVILLTILIYLFLTKYPRNYNIIYKVDSYSVEEIYNKKKNEFLVKVNVENNKYPFIIKHKYEQRQIVKKISKKKIDSYECVIIDTLYDNQKLCLLDGQLVSNSFIEKKPINFEFKAANNIKYIPQKETIFLWNYDGFYLIDNKIKKVDLNISDSYEIKNIISNEEIVIISRPDKEFYYNELIIYDKVDDKVRYVKLDEEISFDSTFQGINKKYLYIYDRKNDVQFKVNYKNGSMKSVGNKKRGLSVKRGFKWTKTKSISKKDIMFNVTEDIFELKNETLYRNIDSFKIKASSLKVKRLVTNKNNNVYYISEDSLYKYNCSDGEVKILEYNELNFNFLNTVYII